MIHQTQPTEKTCGQTCVAMVLGVPVADVIREMGSGPTRGVHLVERLRLCGLAAEQQRVHRICRIEDLPSVAILRVEWIPKQANDHWIVLAHGEVLDPAGVFDLAGVVSGLEFAPPQFGSLTPRVLTRGAVGRVKSYLSIGSRAATSVEAA